MLVPKLRLYTDNTKEEPDTTLKYFVWDDKKSEYVTNRVFSFYDTEDECKEAIDWFNSLSIVKAS